MHVHLIAFGLCLLLILVNLATLAIAAWRLGRDGEAATPDDAPPVSIVIPLRGVEPYTLETLARAFRLSWPNYELIFCVAQGDDPVVRHVRNAIDRHPGVMAQLLFGDDRVSGNPKLNNCIKGWRAARYEWVVLADSNVLMPIDYVQRLMAGWQADTGLVCSPPRGSRPAGFWAEVECAFLNSFQARWQYAAEATGRGFAQGKSMLWRKPLLDGNGGIEKLGEEIAEDAASTKLVNGLGLKVRLTDRPFEQPLGERSFDEVWSRQARWARLRRVTFPLFFAPEILIGGLPPLLLGLFAAWAAGFSLPLAALAIVTVTYLPEYLFAATLKWNAGPRYLVAMVVRDMLLPLIALRGWMGAKVEWRGNAMNIGADVQVLE